MQGLKDAAETNDTEGVLASPILADDVLKGNYNNELRLNYFFMFLLTYYYLLKQV